MTLKGPVEDTVITQVLSPLFTAFTSRCIQGIFRTNLPQLVFVYSAYLLQMLLLGTLRLETLIDVRRQSKLGGKTPLHNDRASQETWSEMGILRNNRTEEDTYCLNCVSLEIQN